MNKVEFNPQKLNFFQKGSTLEKQNAPQQNPFGISFKGKVLKSDVFESSKQNNEAKASIVDRGRLYASAVVGKVLGAREHLNKMMEPVISFTGKIRQNAQELVDRVRAFEIPALSPSEFMSKLTRRKSREMEIRELTQMPVSELEAMLTEQIQSIA